MLILIYSSLQLRFLIQCIHIAQKQSHGTYFSNSYLDTAAVNTYINYVASDIREFDTYCKHVATDY